MTTDQNSGGQQASDTQSTPSGTSPELTGGQGFSFEDAVTSVYAAALLCESTAPGLPGRVVRHISVQQGSFGHPLDDLIVRADGTDQVSITFSIQVKRKLVVSAASKNTDFRETIERAQETLSDARFQLSLDRVGAIVGEISDAAKRSFETLCEWARAESSLEQFVLKLRTHGAAGDKLSQFETVRDILSSKVAPDELDAVTHKLLSHFVLIRLDLLTEGSPTEAQTVATLANILVPVDRPRADDLWRRLLALVRISQGRAAAYDRKTLVARLNGAFRLAGAPSAQGALQAIQQESRLAAAEITNSISGLSVRRDATVQAVVEATKSPGFVQIGGMPGAGKSVVLRSAVEQLAASGTVLLLKSDRLRGSTWAQYAAAAGMTYGNLEELLVELSASGSNVLFVDGIDRVEVEHRGILLDLLNTIYSSTLLSGWCVVATVRDTGMEPLRTWLPAKIFSRGVQTLTVDSFSDEEAETLAQAKPALRPLLFGSDSVRTVVRRPFFAAVLAKEVDSSNAQATSEVDLAALWWERGGYGGDPTRVGYRRNAVVQLAKTGAHQLGRRIPIADVDAQALVELEADGIIRPVRRGHTVQFSHDIFFEWAFLQHLVRADAAWLEVISEVGEPPALGRVVELLSQAELANGENWANYLAALEGNQSLRSQWLRAWMAGPFSLETFSQYSGAFNRAMFDPAHSRVHKVVVWYQAEKTKPNAAIFESLATDLDLAKRMLYADIWGHPSDVAAWSRFCDWLLNHASEIPTSVIPEVVSAFEVWQNLLSPFRNRVSERIVQTCLAWLYHIQHQCHRREFSMSRGVWDLIEDSRDGLDELESSLRRLILNSSLAYGPLVTQYLRDLRHLEQMPRQALESVFTNAPLLSRVCPADLVDFAMSVLFKDLPVVVKKDMRGRGYFEPHSFNDFEWDHLSIDDHFSFSPSAPTREPFYSLLLQAPDQGRRLVREAANHAIRSWRQLHRLAREKDGTPIPIIMQFPWGKQMFWGDRRLYLGARGLFGSSTVNSGWMALEAWAFKELEKGTPVDDILKAVLEGNQSVAALAVAAVIALQAQHISAVTLPIVTNQRLWHWDIRRQVEDSTHSANLIGFFREQDKVHGLAVKEGNELPVRRADIRSLASLMVLRGGELGEQAAAAIQGFSEDLPFDYAEQRDNAEVRSELARTAEIWVEIGKRENYRAELSPDESQIFISHENPQATGEDVQAMEARHSEMGRYLHLLNWTHSYFDTGNLKDSLTLEAAAIAAKELDFEDLFATGHIHTDLAHQRQCAVAGVAAILLLEKAEEHQEWAIEVCVRASQTSEVPQQFFTRTMKLMYHPVLYAAKGLGACFAVTDDDEDVKTLQSLLTQLCAYPYEEIAVAAIGALLSTWPKHPNIAWAALQLTTALALFEVQYGGNGNTEERHFERIETSVTEELRRLQDGTSVAGPLPTWPEPWVPITDREAVEARRRRGRTVDAEWRVNPLHIDTSLLEKVLLVIPVETVLADQTHAPLFLDWCEGLAKWTIDRIAPAWARSRRDLEDNRALNYFKWQRYLYRFLAGVALELPVEESIRRFLQPAMATNDETFAGLCEHFTGHLQAHIADSPEISQIDLELLSVVTQRVLAYQGWRHAGHGGTSERDFVDIVEHLFFANLGYAGLAVRFANRNWAEVEAVIPIFEPILRAHGPVTFVASAWMNLCESSFEHYPVQHFVDNVEHLLVGDTPPPGWRNTQLPGRLSGLIQRFSERQQPMPLTSAQKLLRALDRLVDIGDRRAAAVQLSEVFRSVRVPG